MNADPDSLKAFGSRIQRLMAGKDLTRRETYDAFAQILMNRQPELQQGAFLAALAAKGETPEEIAGAWQAIVDLDTVQARESFPGPLVENSGTGMDSLKTFNVSTAAAIVAAAGGVRLARHGARAITSRCGTVDLMESLGLDVECDVSRVCRSIAETGIGLFNGMSQQIHPLALFRILGAIRFGSTLNISASLASPCRPTHALRGVHSPHLVGKTATVLKEIGYRCGMVAHGLDGGAAPGIDELSTLGETLICEFDESGEEKHYRITPEEVGLRRARYPDIAALADPTAEAVRFLQILAGQGHGACVDMVCLNAAALFRLVGKTETLQEGIDLGRSLIASGAALAKLTAWIGAQGVPGGLGRQRLARVAQTAGVDPA
jgi:anthranilate phosphoribosyltransferase